MCALSTSPNQFANLNINCMTAHIFTAFERSYMYEGLDGGGGGGVWYSLIRNLAHYSSH